MTARTLLVVSARVDDAAREAVSAGRWPRKDFFGLAEALAADVIDHGTVERSRALRAVRRVAGMPVAQACAAFARHRRYGRILTDGEQIGIPLALLLSAMSRAPRHVTIGHLLSTHTKRAVFRWLRPGRRLDTVLLHATRQQTIATDELGLERARTALVPYGVDTAFWAAARPEGEAEGEEALISAAGLEYRDYPTLLTAMGGLPARLMIAAGSRWSSHRDTASGGELPGNVSVASLDYTALRDLYARSRFVVVPLHDIENQAGITTILEAMAMSKAVIVTATRGQRDVVRGRLCTAGGVSDALHGGPAPFGVRGALAEAETGLYVPPGDPAALRRAIQYLLDHPQEAARMGAAGRRLVEEEMSLDLFVQRVAALMAEGPGGQEAGVRDQQPAGGHRRSANSSQLSRLPASVRE